MEKSRKRRFWLVGTGVLIILIIISTFLMLRFLQQSKEEGSNKLSFAFTDSINGVGINVSGQKMPNGKSLADIAKGSNATTEVASKYGTIYIGTNHNGPQWVFFERDNTLVLINSSGTISNEAWKNYIETLKLPSGSS